MRDRLKWWLVVCLSGALAAWSWQAGHIATILALDATYISLLILACYVAATATVGWRLHTGKPLHHDWLQFCAERMVQLGLIGTIAGMILTMAVFANGSFDPSQGYDQIATGSATALYTTIVGVLCSEFLKLQIMVVGGDQCRP